MGWIQKTLGVIGITAGLVEIVDFFYKTFFKKEEIKEVGTQVQYMANANGDHRPTISVNGSSSKKVENCIEVTVPFPAEKNIQQKYDISIMVTRNEVPNTNECARVFCQSSAVTQLSPQVSKMGEDEDSLSSFSNAQEITGEEKPIGYLQQLRGEEEYYYDLLNPFN